MPAEAPAPAARRPVGDLDDPPTSDRRLLWALAGGAVAVAIALVVALGLAGDENEADRTAAAAATSTTVDLATVSNDELAQVVAEHPEIVAMRLRLVERYFRDQDFEDAQHHAEEAAVRATTIEDRSLALSYLGITTALLGDPQEGEGILVQSLALVPGNRSSLYYLARVRYEMLGEPERAIAPLEQLLGFSDLTDDQRSLFGDMLAEVQVASGAAAATTTTATP